MPAFKPSANQSNCTVTRYDEIAETLSLSPAEILKASNIIGLALRMESLPALPDHISSSPFVIRFLPTNNLRLERKDKKGSIRFEWNEGDELINALKAAESISINERTVVKAARGTGAVSHNSEAPFS